MGLEISNEKVFIISLDGATFDVLRPLMAQGYMPNLAKVAEQSLSAELESVIPAVTAPAWTSFMTGKNPGRHGLFGFTQFDPTDGRIKLTNSRNIRSKTIWQILSEKGKRSVVLNLPYTAPPYEINGIIVSGWDSPTTNFTYPEALGKEILELMPDYRSNMNMWIFDYMPGKSEGNFDKLIDTLMTGAEQGTKLALRLLDREAWDVFMVHYQQTDWIQHKVWGHIEEACRNPQNKDYKVERVRECYKKYDEQVGILLNRIAPYNAKVIILSDHGFGDYKGEIFPNYHLHEWGYFHVAPETEDKLKGFRQKVKDNKVLGLFYKAAAGIKHGLESTLTFKQYKKFDSWVEFAGGTFGGKALPVDWKKTKVATVGAYECAFLYVNVIGRSPNGIVEPGAEYERIVSDLIARFSQIKHPVTGEKLYRRVARGTEIYPNASPDILLPDLILLPAEGYGFSSQVSNALPQATSEGVHRHNGVVFLRGDGFRTTVRDFQPYLVDLAPTILHTLGLAVPADMEGRVLEEAFTQARPVRMEQVDNAITQELEEYDESDAKVIEERLKALGYVE